VNKPRGIGGAIEIPALLRPMWGLLTQAQGLDIQAAVAVEAAGGRARW